MGWVTSYRPKQLCVLIISSLPQRDCQLPQDSDLCLFHWSTPKAPNLIYQALNNYSPNQGLCHTRRRRKGDRRGRSTFRNAREALPGSCGGGRVLTGGWRVLTDGGDDAGAAGSHRLRVDVQQAQVFQEGVRHRRRQLLPLEEGGAQLLGQLGHTGPPEEPRWPCREGGCMGTCLPSPSAHAAYPPSPPSAPSPSCEPGHRHPVSSVVVTRILPSRYDYVLSTDPHFTDKETEAEKG